ncbi:MAG: PilZ domain-containing protein [Deltaproteobacteria bacterium]|nr:PilZ domain-containing protein [Deltaproteobacteria bacterium]
MSGFNAEPPPDEAAGLERRQSHRLYINFPVECRVILQGPASQFSSRAMMKNISQGGVYLECDTRPQLSQGQVGHFTLKSLNGLEEFGRIHFAAKGVVRRVKPAKEGDSFGCAVEFLSGPLICFENRRPVIN